MIHNILILRSRVHQGLKTKSRSNRSEKADETTAESSSEAPKTTLNSGAGEWIHLEVRVLQALWHNDTHQLDSSEMFHFEASWTIDTVQIETTEKERYKRLSRLHFLTKIDVARQALIFTFISSRKKITWAYVQELLDILRGSIETAATSPGIVGKCRKSDGQEEESKDKQKRGTEILGQTTATLIGYGSVSLITSHTITQTWNNTLGVERVV